MRHGELSQENLAGLSPEAAAPAEEELRRRLDEELGVRPGPELTEAHVRVLRQELSAGFVAEIGM